MASTSRDYQAMVDQLNPIGAHDQRMRAVVDALWVAFENHGYSWVGFYLDQPNEPDEKRLVLGWCRDKPACSPIGLHGVCGQALLSKKLRIVRDVTELGENYIACDPRDRSEIVIPLLDERGVCWGVLDIDSSDVGAFDESDALGLRQVLETAGLTGHSS
ncbi:MAG: GAF domain-containing protein [Phycisphaerales bacterium]